MTNSRIQSFSFNQRRRVPALLLPFCILAIAALGTLFSSPATATFTSPQAAGSEKRQRAAFVPGEALVRFRKNRAFEGSRQIAVPSSSTASEGSSAHSFSGDEVLVQVEIFAGSDIVEGLRLARTAPGDTLKAIAALNARDDVLYAEPNYILHRELTPNDPRFTSNELYGLNTIAAPLAWDITTGSRSIVVAVIDQGVDINHPDLLANIWTNPSPGSIPGITGDLHGYDFRDNTGTIPAESHGTHVAGTIGAVGDNSVGVVGVNWQVSLMSLRFLSAAAGNGTEADAIKAYNYAKQMRDLWISSGGTQGANIRVVNASYGGGGYSQAAADAINALGQSGVLFVAAAGNESRDTDIQPHYPSGYSLPNVISVTGTTQADQQIFNYGVRSVLMGAPGSSIWSTTPNSGYGASSGTSMATPHVTGAAALLCAANANLTVSQMRALLAFNGDSIGALQGKTLTGRRLNVFKSMQAMSENDTTPPGTAGSLQVNSQNGRSINLSWVASGDDGAAGQASLYDVSFVDQSTSAVIPITTLAPVASGTAQNLNINLPYRHLGGTIRLREFDNVGNEGTPATVPVSVPLLAADPYVTSLNAAAALSTGGTAQGLTFDDRYQEDYSLPFSFPFFGQSYSLVTISTNGNLYFSAPPKRANGDADDVPSSTADLSLRRMISGMWDDLDLRTSRRADADVYVVQPDASRIIFRWQGVQFGDGTNGDPINFEIELRLDGTIVTRYGAGNINLLPVVGISGGEPDPYVIDALTSETSPKTLTNAQSALFVPRTTCSYSLVPTSQTFVAAGGSHSVSVTTQGGCPWTAVSNASWITVTGGASGTGSGTVNYSVAVNTLTTPRSGTMTIAALTFTVNQDGAPEAVIQLGSSSNSIGEGIAKVSITVNRVANTSGTSTVDFTTNDTAGSQGCGVINSAASARCDYVSTARKLIFAPGETTKTIDILIINDAYQEGNETFTVGLSNPTGASLGQSTATVTIVDNDSANGPNPLSLTGFFTRQQYLDFLSREPDVDGFNFWVNNIDSCGSDAGCREVRRIDTSAAFFLSIEFKETGYLVERIYKASFGDFTGTSSTGGVHNVIVPIVRLNEFLPDTQRIGEGVIVNQGNWQQKLEDNKRAFLDEFVLRTRFLTEFPVSMTPTQFVDKLNDKAKDKSGAMPLSTSERNQLIAALTNSTMTRAQVLRAVAEDADLVNSEINRAFVLMEYFGYLRRNPNDAPEATLDYAGYEFWLNKLEQFNGNYINAEMVKAFITSIEYGQRFGP